MRSFPYPQINDCIRNVSFALSDSKGTKVLQDMSVPNTTDSYSLYISLALKDHVLKEVEKYPFVNLLIYISLYCPITRYRAYSVTPYLPNTNEYKLEITIPGEKVAESLELSYGLLGDTSKEFRGNPIKRAYVTRPRDLRLYIGEPIIGLRNRFESFKEHFLPAIPWTFETSFSNPLDLFAPNFTLLLNDDFNHVKDLDTSFTPLVRWTLTRDIVRHSILELCKFSTELEDLSEEILDLYQESLVSTVNKHAEEVGLTFRDLVELSNSHDSAHLEEYLSKIASSHVPLKK